jgi:hypothetical protein
MLEDRLQKKLLTLMTWRKSYVSKWLFRSNKDETMEEYTGWADTMGKVCGITLLPETLEQ